MVRNEVNERTPTTCTHHTHGQTTIVDAQERDKREKKGVSAEENRREKKDQSGPLAHCEPPGKATIPGARAGEDTHIGRWVAEPKRSSELLAFSQRMGLEKGESIGARCTPGER